MGNALNIVYLDVVGPSADPHIARRSNWNAQTYAGYRRRFRDYFLAQAVPDDVQLIILRVNPGDQSDSRTVFDHVRHESMDHTDPTGRDIGAILGAAAQLRRDELTLFVGSTCYPVATNWIDRLRHVWTSTRAGAVAPFASLEVHPHLRTACFATLPRYLGVYPFAELCGGDYYRFEHGSDNFTLWLQSQGFRPQQVTRGKAVDVGDCRKVRNGFRRGNQSELLVRDRHVDAYSNANTVQRLDLRLRAGGIEPMLSRATVGRARHHLSRLSRR